MKKGIIATANMGVSLEVTGIKSLKVKTKGKMRKATMVVSLDHKVTAQEYKAYSISKVFNARIHMNKPVNKENAYGQYLTGKVKKGAKTLTLTAKYNIKYEKEWGDIFRKGKKYYMTTADPVTGKVKFLKATAK